MAGQFSAGDALTSGGNTQQDKLRTLDEQIADLRQKIMTNMQQNKEQINTIDSQIALVHGVRVDVARMQIEGNSGGLSDLIKKGAVVATLQTAAHEYEEKAEKAKTGVIKYGNGETKSGTNY